jgi:hypothetical protein
VADLKKMAEVLGLLMTGSKDELAARVVAFLANPDAASCKRGGDKAAPKRKASTKGKKGQLQPNTVARARLCAPLLVCASPCEPAACLRSVSCLPF